MGPSMGRRLKSGTSRRCVMVYRMPPSRRIFRTSIFGFGLAILPIRLHLLASGRSPHYSVGLIGEHDFDQ